MSKNLAEQQQAAVKEADQLTQKILKSREFQQFCEEVVEKLRIEDSGDEDELDEQFQDFGFDGYWGFIEHEQENLVAVWGGTVPLEEFLSMYSGYWN